MTFEINYTLTREHLETYRKLTIARLKAAAAKTVWWHKLIVWFGLMFAFAIGFNVIAMRTTLTSFAVFIGALAGIAAVVALWCFHSRALQKAMYRPDSPSLSPQHGTINETQLHFSAVGADSTFQWALMTGVAERGDIIVLWIDTCQGVVIPRSAFSDEATAMAFCDFARERIAAARAVPS